MLKCVVIGLAFLCCVSGFEVFSTLAKSTTKRDITPAAKLCFLNALSGDAAGVSSECVQALATAPDDQARKDATCSPLCDSLYAASSQVILLHEVSIFTATTQDVYLGSTEHLVNYFTHELHFLFFNSTATVSC
ncbi:hypothetical protein EMCRGX_G022832 [Ephydatia muelleri]